MTAPDTIRIALADDHGIVRAGLRMLLESNPRIAVVGEVGERAGIMAMLSHCKPDILLLDLDFRGESALGMLPELLSQSAAQIIILTGTRDTQVHRAAVRMGAMGLVVKDQAFEEIVKAIEHVAAGEAWLPPAIVASMVSEFSRGPALRPRNPEEGKIATLTGRERQVIALVCEGLQNKGIAQRLAISETTTRHHLTSIFDKLAVTNRLELLIYAYRWNLAATQQRSLSHTLH